MHPSELTAELLVKAYANGYFPMPDPDTGEVMWFNPEPRAIIPLNHFHASSSLHRSIKRSGWRFAVDTDFEGVMRACADRADTWITDDFVRVYSDLYNFGLAHSVEVWNHDRLVGGLYGVSLGGAFFAESKFHRETDASKAALWYLVEEMKRCKMSLLEVQFMTPHLEKLGAVAIPAAEYAKLLLNALQAPHVFKAARSSSPIHQP